MTLLFNRVITTTRPNCALAGKENIFLHKKASIYNILNDINEQDKSILDCKHKHRMKSEYPPDKVGVLYRLLPIKNSMVSQAELISKGYHFSGPGLISIFLETVWVPLKSSHKRNSYKWSKCGCS